MKLTNNTVFNSFNSLAKLYNTDLPVMTAYTLKKNFEILNSQAQFINECRNDLINKYGHDGQIEESDTEALENFTKDFTQILSVEEEFDITPISITELRDAKLTANDLDILSFMIKA